MRPGFCHSIIIQWMIPSLPSTAVTLHRWLLHIRSDQERGDTSHMWQKTNKPKSTSQRKAQTPRVTWPLAARKTLRQQWNLGRSPKLSRRHLTCITMPRRLSLWLHCHRRRLNTCQKSRKPARVAPSGWCFYPAYAIWWMLLSESWWRSTSVIESDDHGRVTTTHSTKRDY